MPKTSPEKRLKNKSARLKFKDLLSCKGRKQSKMKAGYGNRPHSKMHEDDDSCDSGVGLGDAATMSSDGRTPIEGTLCTQTQYIGHAAASDLQSQQHRVEIAQVPSTKLLHEAVGENNLSNSSSCHTSMDRSRANSCRQEEPKLTNISRPAEAALPHPGSENGISLPMMRPDGNEEKGEVIRPEHTVDHDGRAAIVETHSAHSNIHTHAVASNDLQTQQQAGEIAQVSSAEKSVRAVGENKLSNTSSGYGSENRSRANSCQQDEETQQTNILSGANAALASLGSESGISTPMKTLFVNEDDCEAGRPESTVNREVSGTSNAGLKSQSESSLSAEKSMKYGSMNICLDGVEYSLRTLPGQSEEYEYKEIPDELFTVIQRTCFEEEVMSARLYQAPENCYELLVVGKSATRAQQKLEAALKENDFEEFTIFTENKKGALHVIEFVGPRKKFGVTKEVRDDDEEDGQYHPVGDSACELVLEGDMVDGHDDERTQLFAVVSGHFMLDRGQRYRMQKEDAHKDVKRDIAGASNSTRYVLTMINSLRKVNLRLIPTLFAYRPNRLEQTSASSSDFKSYVSDIGLLQIESHQLESKSGKSISREDIEEGMRFVEKEGGESAALDVVLPVTNYRDLTKMSVNRVCVKIAHCSGYMILDGTDLSERMEMPYHIQFVLERDEWPLVPGHSGSIVYVIDAGTGRYYRFGQLVGKFIRKHRDGMDVYQASVLRQSINEIEARYGHVVKNLRPINQHAQNFGSLSNIRFVEKGRTEPVTPHRQRRDTANTSFSLSLSSMRSLGSARPPSLSPEENLSPPNISPDGINDLDSGFPRSYEPNLTNLK